MALEIADHDLSEEQVAFREILRRFFEEAAPISEVRRVMEESGDGFDEKLWRRASEDLGLAGLAIAEEDGGQGFGLKELGLALAEAGRCLAPLPLFASAGLAARSVAAVAGAEAGSWLGPIAEGRAATLAWVEAGGDWDPAAVEMIAEGIGQQVRLTGAKHFVLGAQGAERIFVVAREAGSHCDEGLGLFCVEAGDPGLRIEARESFDLTRPLATVVLEGAVARAVGPRGGAAPGLRVGLDEATALLCAEMTGGMQKVLEVAVDYAAERFQFSRPIGSFQAIKHKCANLLIEFEAGRTASNGAIVAFDDLDPERFLLASVAKAQCSPSYPRMATENGQIQGGVGYTWEYDAHLYFRRALACRGLLGDERAHHDRVTRMVARGSLEERL